MKETEDTPPMDWQDRVVMVGSYVAGLICLAILLWGDWS